MPNKVYLSARDLADELGISTRRVKALVEAEQLTASGRLKSGQQPYIFDPDVIAGQVESIPRRARPARREHAA